MAPQGGGWSAGLGRPAVVLTGDCFDDAKTAHGLLRRSPLFDLVAIVDVADLMGPIIGVASPKIG